MLLLLYLRSIFTNIDLGNQLVCSLRGLCSSILYEISFDTYQVSIFLSRNVSQERLLMQSMGCNFLFTKIELIHYLLLTCDEFCSIQIILLDARNLLDCSFEIDSDRTMFEKSLLEFCSARKLLEIFLLEVLF